MDSETEIEKETEVVFTTAPLEESSEEPPMDEWSSLIIEVPTENKKVLLHQQGLYDAGSGEICTKYIAMSASSVFRHPYYNYPAVLDPGIKTALLDPEEKKIYPIDGQELYIAICKEMNQCPVKSFYNGLLNDSIDLRYYCIDPFGVRAMAMALSYNRNVTSLDLTDNFLNDDACFHLGEMLVNNTTLKKLILSGCRIGPSGAKPIFGGLRLNRGLEMLNLNKNQLCDDGVERLAEVVLQGIDVKQIYLSYNKMSGKSAGLLAESLETSNKFTSLDLSWNNLYAPIGGTASLLNILSLSTVLAELNLSWNSLAGARIGNLLSAIIKAPNLKILNISNNKFAGDAIDVIIADLNKAKKLVTLDLSFNPMTPNDATKVITKLKLKTVKVQNVLMDNVFVNGAFLSALSDIQGMKPVRNVTYGGVISDFKATGPDMRDLVLNRAEFLTKKGKKQKMDIALFAMQLLKDGSKTMPAKDFENALRMAGSPLDGDLVEEIVNAFAISKGAKTISITLLVEYVQRKWPDRKLPPTPPPEPEPEPEPKKDKKSAGKGKKNKT